MLMGRSTDIDDQRKDEQTNNCDDLDGCENELSLSVDSDGKDVQAKHQDDDNGDPCGHVDVHCTVPVLDDSRGGRDFSAECQSRGIPVVPADSETHRIVDVTSAELWNGTG